MKRKRLILLGGLLLCAAFFLVACGADKEEEKETVLPVSVTEVVEGDLIQTENIPATIEAKSVVDVVPKLAGRVATVHVEEGQSVKKGQLMVQLETKELQIQLAQAQAGLMSAKSALAQARSGIKQAEASYLNAKNSFQRVESLYEQQIISQQDYENSRLQFEIAESAYEAAQQQLAVDPATGAQYLEATVKQAEASVALINANIDNARVEAPISGTVTSVMVEPGEMAGGGVVVSVADMNTVIATAKITQKNVTKIQQGQEVKVKIGASDDFESTYKITKLVPAADKSNTYKLEVTIPNADKAIKPGMTATIQAVTNQIENVLLLPRDAVVKRNGNDIVWVVNNGKVKAADVVTGEYTDELVEIKEGVKAGDQVVTAGQHLLSEGNGVEIQNQGADQEAEEPQNAGKAQNGGDAE